VGIIIINGPSPSSQTQAGLGQALFSWRKIYK